MKNHIIHKYLFFILADIIIGAGGWLLSGLFFNPKPLLTASSIHELFIILWFCYPATFFIYEYTRKRNGINHKRKSEDSTKE